MDGALLGHEIESGSPVELSDADRMGGLYVIGKTGTGKTTLLESLILQDIKRGLGVCVLDPHRDLTNRLLAQIPDRRVEDVVLLDPRDTRYPFGLNPLWCPKPSDADLVDRMASQFVELIEKLWGPQGIEGSSWGPRIPQTLRNVAEVFLENPGLSLADITDFISKEQFRKPLVARCSNAQVRRFWQGYDDLRDRVQEERTDSTLNKLDEFLTQRVVANVVCQPQTSVDFRMFMDEGRIVLVPLGLGHLTQSVVSLFGSMIVLQVLNAALSREDQLSRRRQFNLYADEFQRFATPAFETLLTEARKYGVATTIAHQVRAQLESKVRAVALGAGNIIVFDVQGDDAEELAKEFDRTPPEPQNDGRLQKQSFSPTPTAHLARNGHQDERVRRIVNDWLRDLTTNASSMPEGRYWSYCPDPAWNGWFADEGGYYASRATLQHGVSLLDRYLVDWMEDRITSGNVRQRTLELLIALPGFFRIGQTETDMHPSERPDHGRARRGELFSMPWHPDFGTEELRLLILALFSGSDADEPFVRYGAIRRVFWEAHIERLMGFPEGSSVVNERSSIRALYEAQQAKTRIAELIFLGQALRGDPILVDTAQWELVPQRPRAFADVREETANRLIQQGKFRATCRILEDGKPAQYRIKTPEYQWIELQDEAHSNNIRSIRDRSRERFCRDLDHLKNSEDDNLQQDGDHHSTRPQRFEPMNPPENNE